MKPPIKCIINNKNNISSIEKVAPEKQTIDFLSQFARVYYVEKKLNSKHYGLVLN
jgi:hypothetical protein